jgi:hypothetical protein
LVWGGERKNLDELPEPLKPLNREMFIPMATRIKAFCAGGSDCYEERYAKDRKKTSVIEEAEYPAGEEKA